MDASWITALGRIVPTHGHLMVSCRIDLRSRFLRPGNAWVQLSASMPSVLFSRQLSGAVLDGRLYIAAGSDGTTFFTDTWATSDGGKLL